MIRVGVVGATGYSGRDVIRLLASHPGAELAAVTSTSAAGKRLDEVLPGMRGMTDVMCEPFDAEVLAEKCDAVFIGVPGTKSTTFGIALKEAGARVLDLGPDFRLNDPALFKQYYGTEHAAPEALPEWVYGLVPFYREALDDATCVAVPGCYPISAILPLKPLLDHVSTDVPVVIDSISGISGAGRSLSQAFHFPEMNENLMAYKLAVHQHTPEIEQETGNRALVQFTPHVAPLTRGILTTTTFRPSGPIDVAGAYDCYEHEPFVRVLGEGQIPQIKYVRASNFCDIGWVMDERTGNLVVVSAIDNLMGGTAGMGIQCMNLMFGLDEQAGLCYGGMTP